jgi:hypothetical protein
VHLPFDGINGLGVVDVIKCLLTVKPVFFLDMAARPRGRRQSREIKNKNRRRTVLTRLKDGQFSVWHKDRAGPFSASPTLGPSRRQ